jgi:hypothetical protein
MINAQVKDIFHDLRFGRFDVANASLLERLSASELISDLRKTYPVAFQERTVGRKHEVGIARRLRFEFAVSRLPDSSFPRVFLLPVLWKCLFVSCYDDSISEITIAAGIRLRPEEPGASREVVLTTGRGFKLDRTPDGWDIKPLQRRAVTLSESVLLTRGWKFEVLLPFCSPG